MLPRQFPRWVLETNSSRITNFPRPDPKSVSRAVMKTFVVIQHHCWGSNQETTHCVNSNSLTVKLLGFCCQLLTWKSFGSVSCLACHSPIQDLRNVFVRKLFQSFDLAVKELDLIVQGAHYGLALLAMQDLFHRVHQFPWHIMKAGVFFQPALFELFLLPDQQSFGPCLGSYYAIEWEYDLVDIACSTLRHAIILCKAIGENPDFGARKCPLDHQNISKIPVRPLVKIHKARRS